MQHPAFTAAGLAVVLLFAVPAASFGAGTASITTLAHVERAIDASPHTTVSAYVLFPDSSMVRTLEHAGARVTVVLPANPYDPSGFTNRENAAVTQALGGAGVHVVPNANPLHLKAVVTATTLFLDDTNFSDSSRQIAIQDDSPADRAAVLATLQGHPRSSGSLQTVKGPALAAEAELITHSTGPIALSSESFGWHNPVYNALLAAAARGRTVSVMVAQRDLDESRYENKDLARLAAAGVRVRVADADEKILLTNAGCWIGSANATAGLAHQLDWGLTIHDRSTCAALANHYGRLWSDGRDF